MDLRRRNWMLAAAAALSAAGAAAPPAFAHARLVGTSPADGAIVATAPKRVFVRFDDTVRVLKGTSVIRNADRRSVVEGKPVAKGRTVVIRLRPLANGAYSARWRVLSDDGHTVAGVFAFAVGAASAPPTSELSANTGNPSTATIVSRFLFFAGVLAAAGTAIFFLLAWRRARRAAGIDAGHDSTLWGLMFVGFFLAFLGASGLLPHHGAGTTRFGIVLEVGGVLGLVGATVAAITIVERRLAPVTLAAALGLLVIPTLAGHALDPGWPRPLNGVVDVLHVGAAAVWIGGLLSLLVAVPRALRGLEPDRRVAFTKALVPRLSAIALVSVAVIAATGLVRALSELSSVSQVWTTGYGRALIVKSALLAAVVILGWLNRRRLVYGAALRRNVVAELALLAGVVVAVAFLTELAPGRDLVRAVAAPVEPRAIQPPPPGATVFAGESGTLAVGLAALTDGRVQATLLSDENRGVDGRSVAFLTHRRRLASSSCGPGCYRSAGRVAPGPVTVLIGGSPPVRFVLPRHARPASTLVARARRAFARLRTLVIQEHLASSPTARVFTTWRIVAPNRLAYTTSGNVRAIVIGDRRWDKFGSQPWQRSAQSPLQQPAPWWGPRWIDPRMVGVTSVGGRRAQVITFFDPELPAWFEVAVAPKSALPLALKMTAAAHFMRHRYLDFNRPLRIVPPA